MRIGFMMGYNRERMEFAKKNGFKSAEFQAGTGDPFWPGQPNWKAKADEAKAAFAALDIRLSCIASFYGPNHLDPATEAEGKKVVRGAIELAQQMGIPVVAGFSGRVNDPSLEASLPKFKEVWSEHAKFAEDHGIKIAFENCPMGHYCTPAYGCNLMSTPQIWEKAFNLVDSPALGLEWDPSHLICQMVDPTITVRQFGSRIYHIHAKDAHVIKEVVDRYGFWADGAVEHCFPGVGDTDWAQCAKELLRANYQSDLNIEGWHDGVYRGDKEDLGLIIALKHLELAIGQQD